MSLQERTLVVKNFDPEKTTPMLLKELCIQAGPVKNVVIKPDHAFVEFEDVESVGYSKALLDGVVMFGQKLILEPKLKAPFYFKYTKLLSDYINYDKQKQQQAFDHHRAMSQQEFHRQQLANKQMPQNPAHQPQDSSTIPQFAHSYPQQYPINFVQSADPQILNPNAFLQPQFAIPDPVQPQWRPQMPIQMQMIPQQIHMPTTSRPEFNYQQPNSLDNPPAFNQFRPHLPRDLAKRPWSDKDRWNRRR